jgi:Concanavalin A-like lectin/glucanases superfamily
MTRAQISSSATLFRAVAAGLCACVVVAASPLSPAAHAGTDRLSVSFDADGASGTQLTAPAVVLDASGNGNNGVVQTGFGGSVGLVSRAGGVAADFPKACTHEPCPNAMVEIADSDSLDPGIANFEWGARIRLQKAQTADGENVLQKGTWGEPGGQWKLQVDKNPGIPSCVVSGVVPGEATERRIVLKASISVADGTWHRVTCRRAAGKLEIVIDGTKRGSAPMPAVDLSSSASVTIGAKWVTSANNDQFQGTIDDVLMTVL